jgi:hypothetical protein
MREPGAKTMTYLNITGLSHKSNANVHPLILASVLLPTSGARMHTVVEPAKTVAQIFVAPGSGLSKRLRRLAETYDHVHAVVRAESYLDRPVPSSHDFHSQTLGVGFPQFPSSRNLVRTVSRL